MYELIDDFIKMNQAGLVLELFVTQLVDIRDGMSAGVKAIGDQEPHNCLA
jgi:hypothetical protein